ncbi:unnamed protein product, partial [Cladocopium goreaui]
AAHSQTASLAIAGTAVAALTAGGRKALGNVKPTRVRQFFCEREACVFLREDVGHVVKDHAFGCAGPYGAVGKWDNVRIEMHYYFIYTSRVCAKMSLAG